MKYSSWRGDIGVIKPSYRPGSLEEFIRLMPAGIGIIPLFLNVSEGTAKEFTRVLGLAEAKVAELAALGVDLIHPEGAPLFMIEGRAGEKAIVERWEQKYGVPILTGPMTQVDALRAMGAKRIVGMTYLPGDINQIFTKYFEEAGFEVLAMEAIDVTLERVNHLSSQQIYNHVHRTYRAHKDADTIYMLGSGWRCLDIIDLIEQDTGLPVVHAIPARVWGVQQWLDVRETHRGFGRLLSEMPRPVPATD